MNELITNIREFLEYIPDWLAGVGIFVLAATIAMILYIGTSKVVLTLTRHRAAYVRSIFLRTRRLLLFALILVASSFAAQLPYFSEGFAELTSKLISATVMVLTGWSAIIAIDVGSSIYFRMYKMDVPDNLAIRKHFTQIRVLKRTIDVMIILITLAAALMVFEPVRQFGISLFASAGVAGLVAGLAARPVLSNLIAGIQLAITQPIRLDDAVIVEGEFGTIEEITSTYVVIKIWDLRRLIVPLSYFMEKSFQNWTRESSQLIGTVFLQTDYTVSVPKLRAKLEEVVRASNLWDGEVLNLQVTDFKDATVELRILVSAATNAQAWDLRCEVREKMLSYLQAEYPNGLPRERIEISGNELEPQARIS